MLEVSPAHIPLSHLAMIGSIQRRNKRRTRELCSVNFTVAARSLYSIAGDSMFMDTTETGRLCKKVEQAAAQVSTSFSERASTSELLRFVLMPSRFTLSVN